MPLFLSQRDRESQERMDNPDCDLAELENTYRQFPVINSLISRWRHIYKKTLRPELAGSRDPTLLDIGFGGGDIPIKLAGWASEDGINLQVTAVDNDDRAFRFIQKKPAPSNVRFRHAAASALRRENRAYDFVISNHLLHHLDDRKLQEMLATARKLSRRMVLFNDIERTDTGYLLFNILSRPLFRSSFITADGLTSIRRSYTCDELRAAVPEGWQVTRLFPFRLLLTYRHDRKS